MRNATLYPKNINEKCKQNDRHRFGYAIFLRRFTIFQCSHLAAFNNSCDRETLSANHGHPRHPTESVHVRWCVAHSQHRTWYHKQVLLRFLPFYLFFELGNLDRRRTETFDITVVVWILQWHKNMYTFPAIIWSDIHLSYPIVLTVPSQIFEGF